MAVSKRAGPDILYLSNAHSQKMKDLEANKEVNITFHDSKTQDWISITGTAATVSNTDPRIKEIHSAGVKAWFGDLGDGKHDGGPEDPRMTLIEVRAKYVVYYKTSVGALGMLKEVGGAMVTGKVANTGSLRELKEADLEKARSMS
jgi:general stress protein 26